MASEGIHETLVADPVTRMRSSSLVLFYAKTRKSCHSGDPWPRHVAGLMRPRRGSGRGTSGLAALHLVHRLDHLRELLRVRRYERLGVRHGLEHLQELFQRRTAGGR